MSFHYPIFVKFEISEKKNDDKKKSGFEKKKKIPDLSFQSY